jgi:hypothetical protein
MESAAARTHIGEQQIEKLASDLILSEKLPEVGERVRVWNFMVHGTVAEENATFEGGKFIDESGTNTDLTRVVSHWMPVAYPPKDRVSNG